MTQRPHRTARLTALDTHVQLQDRQALQSACDALTQGFDFADALHHASSRQCDALATFDDKGFAQRAAAKGWVPKVLVP